MSTAASRFMRHDLMCSDVPEAVRFYGGLFGWTMTDVKSMGEIIVRLTVREQELGARSRSPPQTSPMSADLRCSTTPRGSVRGPQAEG